MMTKLLRTTTMTMMVGASTLCHGADLTLEPTPYGIASPSVPAPMAGNEGAKAVAELHRTVSAAATPVVDRQVANGKACAALVRAGLLDKSASAQLRCILEGPASR